MADSSSGSAFFIAAILIIVLLGAFALGSGDGLDLSISGGKGERE